MAEQNFDNFGEKVKERVDQAVRYGDFTNLSRSVGDIINNTIDGAKNTVRVEHTRTIYSENGSNTYRTQTKSTTRERYATSRAAQTAQNGPALYQRMPTGKVAGILMCAGGYAGLAIFGFFLLIFSVLGMAAIIIVFGILTAACLVLAVLGTKRIGLANRFLWYARLIKQQTYVPIQMLVDQTGRSAEKIMRDLKKMIEKRMFLQAHLDEGEKCLILTDSAYEEYLAAKTSYDARRLEEEKQKQERDRLSPEHKALIEAGESYIKHIHACNEALPGEEISAKLDTMERVVTRIFAVVQAHPETAKELGKLMNYYLPTTKKLLDAYCEMDGQPAEGTNISETKREIEDTLDTLNVAFEKLLDGLFQDKAMDISTDISVLNTILAQEGLKEDGLKQQK